MAKNLLTRVDNFYSIVQTRYSMENAGYSLVFFFL